MQTQIITISENEEKLESLLYFSAEVIKNGGLVVFPTETVYGLGADATNASAAKRIYSAKGRPQDNPLIIHLSDPRDAEKYAFTSETYYKLYKAFMPGPLTVIMKSKDTVPKETRGGLDTVAVRCPENKIARTLIKLSGVPIAAPSANLSGSPSPTTARHVIDDMMGRVDVIIDGGKCDFGLESTIVKIEDDESLTLLRPGKITLDMLLSVVEDVKVADAVTSALKEGEKPLSPGMKYRHYAPKSPLVLLHGDAASAVEYIKREGYSNIGVITYNEDVEFFKSSLAGCKVLAFGNRNDEITQANNLFEILRDADRENFDMIYAPLPRKEGVGLALYNRLIRAAAHTIINL